MGLVVGKTPDSGFTEVYLSQADDVSRGARPQMFQRITVFQLLLCFEMSGRFRGGGRKQGGERIEGSLEGSEKRHFKGMWDLAAQKQWTGLAEARTGLFLKKLQAWGETAHQGPPAQLGIYDQIVL